MAPCATSPSGQARNHWLATRQRNPLCKTGEFTKSANLTHRLFGLCAVKVRSRSSSRIPPFYSSSSLHLCTVTESSAHTPVVTTQCPSRPRSESCFSHVWRCGPDQPEGRDSAMARPPVIEDADQCQKAATKKTGVAPKPRGRPFQCVPLPRVAAGACQCRLPPLRLAALGLQVLTSPATQSQCQWHRVRQGAEWQWRPATVSHELDRLGLSPACLSGRRAGAG